MKSHGRGRKRSAPDNDLVIFDFEGQPQHLVSERQLKHSPLRDVAREGDARAWQEVKCLTAWADLWYGWIGSAFLRAYLATAGAGAFLLPTRADLLLLLEHCLLATGVATLREMLDTRPRQAWVALDGLLHLLEAPSALAPKARDRGHPQRRQDQAG